VATAPQTLTLKTHRDRKNWWQSVWIRRVLLLLPALLVVAGLANRFGQRPTISTASTGEATLTVVAPTHGRSGIIYAARFRVDAQKELKKATLVLDAGWADGYTVNGQSPQPVAEGSANGKLTFDLGHIPAGREVTFWLSLQINPTTIGRHRQNVWLYDGKRLVTVVHRSIRIFP
jgi:hypothetical protein